MRSVTSECLNGYLPPPHAFPRRLEDEVMAALMGAWAVIAAAS